MPPIDRAKAEQALAKGIWTPEQFGRAFSEVGPELPPEMQPMPMAEPVIGADLPPPSYFQEEHPLARQRDFWAQKKAKDDAAIAAAEQRRIDEENAGIERRRQIAAQMGYSQADIDANLPSGFKAPLDTSPVPVNQDPYLAHDAEQARADEIMKLGLGNNYPGAGAYGQIRQGIIDQGKALQESSREQAIEYQAMMDKLDEYGKNTEIRNIAQNTQSEKALADLEAMREDLASTKIDSKRMFHNMGTGDKILASIGLILGGFGGAASGGQNRAVETIERAIERDVNDQKAAYNIKKEGMQHKDSLYGRMLEKFKNEGMAREASRMNMLKMAEVKLAEIGARYTDASTQGKVQEQIGKLQLLQDQAKAAFMNHLMGGDDPYRNMTEAQAKRYVPGYGFAPNEKLAALATEAATTADTAIGNINTILTKAQKAGRFDTGANHEIGVLVQLLRSESREAILGPGTVQGPEREMLEDLIANPGDFFRNRAKAQKALEYIRDAAARTRDIKHKTYGLRGRTDRFRTWEPN